MYYNELDPYALEWIVQLARCGTLKAGELDGRDIKEVRAADLAGHERCHFFAGIGGWEYALMLAGWKGEVWTGSCPCQPFSQAGKRKGTSDERHLWPVWRDLIAECRPPVVFGEQVASPLGREWLSGVRAEMEALGYEVGAADLCAAGVGAPHIRQRLFWGARRVEDALYEGPPSEQAIWEPGPAEAGDAGTSGGAGGLAYTEDAIRRVERDGGESGNHHQAERTTQGRGTQDGGSGQFGEHCAARRVENPECGGGDQYCPHCDEWYPESSWRWSEGVCPDCGLGNTMLRGQQEPPERDSEPQDDSANRDPRGADADGSNPWSSYELIPCADGKARRIEPGTFPLAHGVPNRVGRLRAYGNAIVPQVAATFVRAFMEADKASTSAEQAERAGGA